MHEVVAGERHYVIRGERVGYPSGSLGMSSWGSAVMWLRRLAGERRWKITVRRWADDPFGPTIFEEVAPTGRAAQEAVDRLERDLRSGRVA